MSDDDDMLALFVILLGVTAVPILIGIAFLFGFVIGHLF
jgi:hypothetical protein